MTLPNGAAGVDSTTDGITGDDGSIPAMANLSQVAVTNTLKARYIGTAGSGTSIWTSTSGPLALVFAGISGGLPGIFSQLVQKFFGGSTIYTTVEAALNAIETSPLTVALEDIPILGPIVDGIFHAITGFVRSVAGSGNASTDLTTALQNIPSPNVLGYGGPSNIGATAQATWDQLISGFVGSVGTGASLSSLFNVGQEVSSWASLGRMSFDILGIRNNKPLEGGLASTSESNVSLSKLALQSSAPTIAVTQSASAMSFQRISESGTKGSVQWLGSGNTSITGFHVCVWQMDTSTGGLTLVHSSPDLSGFLSPTMAWTAYELQNSSSILTPLAVTAGDVYGIELCVVGSGTHNVSGQSTWLPLHPTTYPKGLAATRNSGTTFPPSPTTISSPTYSSNVPYVELALNVSGTPPIPHAAETVLVQTSGSVTIPGWCNLFDVIALGAGGGGSGRGGAIGIQDGGYAGSWNGATKIRGTDIPSGTTTLTVTVGDGGPGGAGTGTSGNPGSAGTSTSVAATGMTTVTASGGAGGIVLGGGSSDGQSPGTYTYNGIAYAGGAAQYLAGAAGNPPGGAGSGAAFPHSPGGAGAKGAALIVFRQS